MARLEILGTSVEADLVIFDKDGTLIDFEYYWGRRMRHCGQRLVQCVGGDPALAADLFASLGYDPASGLTDGAGPLATATMAKIYTVATVVLYQHGIGWDQAEEYVRTSFVACASAIPTIELVRSLGQVQVLFESLAWAGVRVAVVTSDDHNTATETLALMGVDDLVSAVTGGDDGFAMKPAPDAFIHVCRRLEILPSRAMMVGDTVADLVMAQRARAGIKVGVLSGVSTAAELAPYADFIIPSIDAIHIA